MKKPTAQMLEFFKQRTQDHINRVIQNMSQLVGFDGLTAQELSERARAHDQDKYTGDKVIPYIWTTEYHRQNNEGDVDDTTLEQYELAREAIGDHVTTNRHHPEAFENIEDMELLDLAEMVSDWFAMGEELGNSARVWADDNVGTTWKFTDDQVDTIYALIDHVEDKIQTKQARVLNQLDALRSAVRKYRKNKVGYEKVQKAIDRARAIGYSQGDINSVLSEEGMRKVKTAGARREDIQDAKDVLRGFIAYDDLGRKVGMTFRWADRRAAKQRPLSFVLQEIERQAQSNAPKPIPISKVYTHDDWDRRVPKARLKNPIIVLELPNQSIIKGKKYVVLDGQHRVFTLEEQGQSKVAAYVVKLPYTKMRGGYGLVAASSKVARVQNKTKAVQKAARQLKKYLGTNKEEKALAHLDKIVEHALDVGHGYTYFDIQTILREEGIPEYLFPRSVQPMQKSASLPHLQPGYFGDLKKFLEKGVFIVDGEGSIDLDDEDLVHVAVVFETSGYGPHMAAIYVDQNRYHASPDTALQGADEILEEYKWEHYSDEYDELVKDFGEQEVQDYGMFTERFDGAVWTLDPVEAAQAIQGTKAEKFIDIYGDNRPDVEYSPRGARTAALPPPVELAVNEKDLEVLIDKNIDTRYWDSLVVDHINYADAYEGEVEGLELMVYSLCTDDSENAFEIAEMLGLDMLPLEEGEDVFLELKSQMARNGYTAWVRPNTLPSGQYDLDVLDGEFGFVFWADAEDVDQIRRDKLGE